MTAIQPILTIGDPRLRQIARPISPDSRKTDLREGAAVAQALLQFRETYGWGRGLAAPQIGLSVRMVAFDLGGGPFLALNPEISWRSTETAIVLDDCLCLPGIAAPVERHASVSVSYMDVQWQPQRLDKLPFDLSELMQHEIDHLDGILFVDRITDPKAIVAREHKALAERGLA